MVASDKPASLRAGTKFRLLKGGLRTVGALLFGRVWRWRRKPSTEQVAVFVTRSDIDPADHGAAVKIRRLAASMSRGLDAVFIVTDDRNACYVYRNGACGKHMFPAWVRWAAPLRSWVKLKLLLHGFPVSNLFLYYPLADFSYVLRALSLGRSHKVVLWQAEFPAYARACIWGRSIFGGAVVLAEHNVEYERIREQVGMRQETYELLRHWELKLCHEADAVVCVSESDRDKLKADGVPADTLHVIPHGVDTGAFATAEPVDLLCQFDLADQSVILVFHGTYRYPPNLEAMQWLAREILPHLEDLRIEVLAIGKYPPASSLHPKVHFTGAVADIAPYLTGADIAVVPLLKGGGTRMKVLDYFAAGVPVVATSKGVEGLPVHHGREIWIADSADDFIRAITRLIDDSELRTKLVEAGREFVSDLSWDAIADRYLALLSECNCATIDTHQIDNAWSMDGR